MVRCVLHSEGWPIPQCRVFQRHICLDPNDCIAWLECPIKHFAPQFHVELRRVWPAWAFGFVDSKHFECLARTLAYISKSFVKHLFCMLVVVRDLVTRNDNAMRCIAKQPFCLFWNVFIGLRKRRLDDGVGIVKSKNEFSVPFLGVFSIDDNSSGVPKTE